MTACVYIMASKKDGVLYIGVTNDLVRRVSEHKSEQIDGFTKEYHVKRLVYYEVYDDIRDAIAREKAMKAWKRDWKINRIIETNPDWLDLFEQVAG